MSAVADAVSSYPEAWQAFKKALLIEEDNGRVKCNMAHHITAVLQMENDASGRREKYQEAENIYTQVLQDEHYKCAQAWSGLATLYNAESEFTHDNYKENKLREMATEAFSHAIDLAPHDAVVWTQLGLLSVAQADYAKAEEYLRTVLEKNRNIMTAWCNLGITLQLADRLDEAVRTYNKALELMPRAYQIYNNLGNVFRQQNKFEEAQRMYKNCLDLKDDYALAYNNLGLLYIAVHRLDDAQTMLEKALKIDESLECARSNLLKLKVLRQREAQRLKALTGKLRPGST
mmetsp:Transcript_71449/g.168357  ORF Transcript_71449/g.168357 Transcript_71449/m.168357 type:complete len:289 (+) Transcript_71449:745-1611(+)